MPRPAPWSTSPETIEKLQRILRSVLDGPESDEEKLESFIAQAKTVRMEGKPSRKQLKDLYRNWRRRLFNDVDRTLTADSDKIAKQAFPLDGQRARAPVSPPSAQITHERASVPPSPVAPGPEIAPFPAGTPAAKKVDQLLRTRTADIDELLDATFSHNNEVLSWILDSYGRGFSPSQLAATSGLPEATIRQVIRTRRFPNH